MLHYAVMGQPIAHSLSPQIHQLFAAQTGRQLSYDKLEVAPQIFTRALQDFVTAGGNGLNITVPLKHLAWERMDELDSLAERAQAVNTIAISNSHTLKGYNTDGIGLVRDLTQNHGINLAKRKILIIGAGGAVQGVLQALLERNPMEITVANRTPGKAEALIKRFVDLGALKACSLEALYGQHYDLIINGTSAGLSGQVPDLPPHLLCPGGISYDMMYNRHATAFVHWGRAQGAAKALDGLGMLVEQAAEAFYIWHDLRPETAPVLQALRPHMP